MAASGTFPIEQTNETIATNGPMNGPTVLDPIESADKKKACQNSLGTQAASAQKAEPQQTAIIPPAISTEYRALA
jgi:hypothetical protein